ncbi:hypothetical protein DPMN_057233 [Dreissena polymorpha]|uniref:Uncharacterized protein n=1 Tax=Dreissena polymorpha TaxID=45954 RepID=A0A9D4CW38_DREPO|nr:hypothetical protein DPMN_057233 [Dreissena polymorpha]
MKVAVKMDNMKEWKSLPTKELLPAANNRPDRRNISMALSIVLPRRQDRSWG